MAGKKIVAATPYRPCEKRDQGSIPGGSPQNPRKRKGVSNWSRDTYMIQSPNPRFPLEKNTTANTPLHAEGAGVRRGVRPGPGISGIVAITDGGPVT